MSILCQRVVRRVPYLILKSYEDQNHLSVEMCTPGWQKNDGHKDLCPQKKSFQQAIQRHTTARITVLYWRTAVIYLHFTVLDKKQGLTLNSIKRNEAVNDRCLLTF